MDLLNGTAEIIMTKINQCQNFVYHLWLILQVSSEKNAKMIQTRIHSP